MKNRTTLVAKIFAIPFVKKTRHYVGLPPQLTGGTDTREEMIRPAFLTIEEKEDGVFLTRFTSTGEYVGDTWHESIELAERQAEFEFRGFYSDWRSISEDIEDPTKYVLAHPKIFETIYRIVLEVKQISVTAGPQLAIDILKGFSARPWNTNVICLWNAETQCLTLQADNEYDKKGLVLKAELADELSSALQIENIPDNSIKIISVTTINS
jgi:hypothetical protein